MARHPYPPEAPDTPRRLRMRAPQAVGMLVLLGVTALAVLGLFDPAETQVHAASDQLELQVRYPSRLRYKMDQTVAIQVRNTSSDALADVQVAVVKPYLDAFGNVRFHPSASLVTQEAYVVQLGELEGGGTREVTVELEARRRGWHEGTISVSAAGMDELRVVLKGVVLP